MRQVGYLLELNYYMFRHQSAIHRQSVRINERKSNWGTSGPVCERMRGMSNVRLGTYIMQLQAWYAFCFLTACCIFYGGFMKTHRYKKKKIGFTWNIATSGFSVHCPLYQQTCYNWCLLDRASLIQSYRQPTSCNNNGLLIIPISSTCFGRWFRPSSGALDCVYSLWLHYSIIGRNMLNWLELLINRYCCI